MALNCKQEHFHTYLLLTGNSVVLQQEQTENTRARMCLDIVKYENLLLS